MSSDMAFFMEGDQYDMDTLSTALPIPDAKPQSEFGEAATNDLSAD